MSLGCEPSKTAICKVLSMLLLRLEISFNDVIKLGASVLLLLLHLPFYILQSRTILWLCKDTFCSHLKLLRLCCARSGFSFCFCSKGIYMFIFQKFCYPCCVDFAGHELAISFYSQQNSSLVLCLLCISVNARLVYNLIF